MKPLQPMTESYDHEEVQKHITDMENAYVKAQTRITQLEDALRSLLNEVAGMTGGFFDADLRDVLGNTHFDCLVLRKDEARALLKDVAGE